MSSCKLWKERRPNGLRSEVCNASTTTCRMSPLLRLDSTGEISSDEVAKPRPGQNSNCNDQMPKPNNLGNHFKLKELVDGFNMTSVFESANVCFGSASSYLEGFCNSKSKRNLVCGESDTTALRYFHNMWKKRQPVNAVGMDQTGSFDLVLPSHNCESIVKTKSPLVTPTDCMQPSCSRPTKTMPKSILGIFQNTFGSCSAEKYKPVPYIQPPIKRRANEYDCKNRAAVFDPKLTPYNARLLERGKLQKKSTEYSNKRQSHKGNIAENSKDTVKSIDSCEIPHSLKSADAKFVDQETLKFPTCDNKQDRNISDLEADPSDIINDWFDYKNENTDDNPSSFNSSDSLQNTMSTNSTLQCEDVKLCNLQSTSPSLISWCSVELDSDVHKAAEDAHHSSQKEESQKTSSRPTAINPRDSGTKIESAKFDNGNTNASDTPDIQLEPSSLFPSILYVRNLQTGRKCRPSSKKRRRQKSQPVNSHNGPENKKNSSTKKATGSVAFILDINQNSKQNSHPFLISCDTDSSEWSDSDLETGTDDGESVADMCSFNNPFSLFNLEVMCSIQPPTPTHGSALDAINLSWQVNVSVDPADEPTEKEKPASKKVRFMEGGSLATVHRMVAWSYAYSAARRGPWEEMARDRGRFLRRIMDGNKLLAPILDPHHRRTVQQDRFTTEEA